MLPTIRKTPRVASQLRTAMSMARPLGLLRSRWSATLQAKKDPEYTIVVSMLFSIIPILPQYKPNIL